MNSKRFFVLRFRPLTGNYISQYVKDEMDKDKQAKFPSPVGELHFSMGVHMIDEIKVVNVSVPCRGTTFLNNYEKIYHYCHYYGFRPLSGNYISQYSREICSQSLE